MKVALITGVAGQDGSYLAEFLLKIGYVVHGTVKPSARPELNNLKGILETELGRRLFIHECDLTDGQSISTLVAKILPSEIYNLGAQSHVATSFVSPEYTANVNALGCLRLLETIRQHTSTKAIRFYQASTSELFGQALAIPQSETTPFNPRSPYAISKLYAYWLTVNYREAYGIFACNGILFNHESPRRPPTFVTRKITRGIALIAAKRMSRLSLGNLDAKRDWGHARDYVEMQWRMLQTDVPMDFVISSGNCFSVREFILVCVEALGIEICFNGRGIDEIAVIKSVPDALQDTGFRRGETLVDIDKNLFRPTEVDYLLGDSTLAKSRLGWSPKTRFRSLVTEMLREDLISVELHSIAAAIVEG
jgi:GDPmannose 4,6-dehydratase